jgi:P-type Ca2+ transporter type 2C
MERKPRPLSEPMLSRGQWMRIIFVGLLVALGTLILEYLQVDPALAATMGFAVFSLCNVTIALSVRDENASVFNREILSDRRQLLLFGLSLLLTFVPVELGFPRFLGLSNLNMNQWLICIAVAVVVLLVDEVIKIFRRRSLAHAKAEEASVAIAEPART